MKSKLHKLLHSPPVIREFWGKSLRSKEKGSSFVVLKPSRSIAAIGYHFLIGLVHQRLQEVM